MSLNEFSRFDSSKPMLHSLVVALSFVLICGCGSKPVDVSGTSAQVTGGAGQAKIRTPPEGEKKADALPEVVFDGETLSEETIQTWLNNPALRRLRLAGSGIDDAALIRLAAKIQKIELLDLTGCDRLTSTGIEAIGSISSLRNLRVGGPAVTDASIASFSKLANLGALSLQQTAVTNDGLQVITSMTGLKELNLYGTSVTDGCLKTVAQLPNLQKLRLRGTRVTGQAAQAFADMVSLIDLDLSETAFSSDGLKFVGKIPRLKSLNLWLTKVDDVGVENLSEQRALTLLNLDNVVGITDKSLDTISRFSDLELLHLGGTSVSSDGLPKLYGLKKLKTLFVTRLKLQASDVQMLRDAMPWVSKLES